MPDRPSAGDPFDLARFVDAQANVLEVVMTELRACRKRSHWMWFAFPQIDGLGSSATSRRYAIRSAAEARAYANHPLLGPRLVECAEALLRCAEGSARQILGSPDDMKLRSSATLFAAVSKPGSVFHRVLARFFDGAADPRTLELLERTEAAGE